MKTWYVTIEHDNPTDYETHAVLATYRDYAEFLALAEHREWHPTHENVRAVRASTVEPVNDIKLLIINQDGTFK